MHQMISLSKNTWIKLQKNYRVLREVLFFLIKKWESLSNTFALENLPDFVQVQFCIFFLDKKDLKFYLLISSAFLVKTWTIFQFHD